MALVLTLQHWEYYTVNGAPVVGANVYLRAATTAHPNASLVLATTTTDADGRWIFSGLSDAADYDVEVAFSGVSRWYKGFSYFSAQVQPANFGSQAQDQVLITPVGAAGRPTFGKVAAAHITAGTMTDGSKFAAQVKNKALIGPVSGADAVPTFRILDDADIPKTLTGMTFTTPTIGSFTNAQHNHLSAAGGGIYAPWAVWTPTLSQGAASATVSITEARYTLIGTLLVARCRVQITNAGSLGSEMFFNGFPVNMRSGIGDSLLGYGYYFDTGSAFYIGSLIYAGVLNGAKFVCHNSPNALGATPNIAFANGDVFSLTIQYET